MCTNLTPILILDRTTQVFSNALRVEENQTIFLGKKNRLYLFSHPAVTAGGADELFAMSRELERPEALEEEVEAEKNLSDFCISSVKSASQVASTGGNREVENMTMRVAFDLGSDAGELRLHADDCEN